MGPEVGALGAPATAYVLPEKLRVGLAEAWGPVVWDDTLVAELARAGAPPAPIFAVGDHVSLSLKRAGITPQLIAVDFKTQRGAEDPTYRSRLGTWGTLCARVTNPPGFITRDAWLAIADAATRPVEGRPWRVEVDGEEDLLGLALLCNAPDGVFVYGMPGHGAVVVRIDDELRGTARKFIGQMERS